MKLRNLFLTFALLSVSAFAADVDGKWEGALETPQGAITIAFNFKADGATLTGTTTGPDGSELTIKNGKLEGDKLSFDVEIDFGGMPFTMSYKGEIKDGALNLVADFAGMPFEMTVKKAKA